jgi:hypothetical protein
MQLKAITYSREEAIAAITDYYKFLTRLYLHESHVVYPPAGGWPAILNADPTVLQLLGKSDEVLALLAHLPYVTDETVEISPDSTTPNWAALISGIAPGDLERIETRRALTEGRRYREISPPHVVGLVLNQEEAVVLDMERGVIIWEDCPSWISDGDPRGHRVPWDLDDGISPEQADWYHDYNSIAWGIGDFFDVLKEQFVKLDWVPISHFAVLDGTENNGWDHEEGMLDSLRHIYRQHGWPDLETYRKEECLAAVLRLMAEKYPESACWREAMAGF